MEYLCPLIAQTFFVMKQFANLQPVAGTVARNS